MAAGCNNSSPRLGVSPQVQLINLSVLNMMSEIESVYKNQIRPSERPLIKSAKECYELLRLTWDENKIGFVEQFKVILMNRAQRVLGIYELTTSLVCNNYLEFEKVIDKLLEGLLMTYAFNPHQSTRIVFVNDYLLSRIIMFAQTENIIKYYNRFNLTSLKYKKDLTTKSEITEHAKIFFLGMDKLYRSDDYKSSYTIVILR